LHQEYIESLAIIAWHNGDEFEFPQGMVRDGWYGITGYPTVWFDGWKDVIGGYDPTSYPYYVPVMLERVPYPSNYEVHISITNVDVTELNVEATVDIKNGNSTENLAGFVVLTETDLVSPGNENQYFVARNVYPDAMGLPIDFSSQTSHTWNTAITIEDNYVLQNCEIIVFIENMDTKEIYQGTSKMAYEITGVGDALPKIPELNVYPNPANDRVTIKASQDIGNIRVYNHERQLVYDINGNSKIMNINTVRFAAGLYLFQVQTADGMFVKRVTIE